MNLYPLHIQAHAFRVHCTRWRIDIRFFRWASASVFLFQCWLESADFAVEFCGVVPTLSVDSFFFISASVLYSLTF